MATDSLAFSDSYPKIDFYTSLNSPHPSLLNQFLPPLLHGISVHTSSSVKKPSAETHLLLLFPSTAVDQAILYANLDRKILLQQQVFPSVYLPITPELKDSIEKNSIYKAHGDQVFLDLSENGAIFLRYQSTLGSQRLSDDNFDFINKLTQQLGFKMRDDRSFSHPVERFRESKGGSPSAVIYGGSLISAVLTDKISSLLDEISSTLTGIDSRLDSILSKHPVADGLAKSNPSDFSSTSHGMGQSPTLARALTARGVASGRRSNASSAVLDDLSKLTFDSSFPDRLNLPDEQLPHYAKVKALITTAGGKYNSKGFFSFPLGTDVQHVHQSLLSGSVVNDKKEFQFFATPHAQAVDLCDRAGDLAGKRVLEPSAGDGALADIARDRGAEVVVVENWVVNVEKLKAKGYAVIDKNFLDVSPQEIGLFDVILANPPFSKNQDIDHVLHMLKFLEPDGVLSAITSQTWERGSQKKQQEFASFMDQIKAEVVPVASGAFKESGTDVPTFKIVIHNSEVLALENKSKAKSFKP